MDSRVDGQPRAHTPCMEHGSYACTHARTTRTTRTHGLHSYTACVHARRARTHARTHIPISLKRNAFFDARMSLKCTKTGQGLVIIVPRHKDASAQRCLGAKIPRSKECLGVKMPRHKDSSAQRFLGTKMPRHKECLGAKIPRHKDAWTQHLCLYSLSFNRTSNHRRSSMWHIPNASCRRRRPMDRDGRTDGTTDRRTDGPADGRIRPRR